MFGPRFFSFRGSFDLLKALLVHIAQAIAHPFDILFDTARHVAERRAVMGSDQSEEIRKACDLYPEVGLRAIGPFFFERLPIYAANIDPGQRPGHGVKTRRVNYQVKLVLRVAGLYALGRDALDWRLFEIHQRDVVAIELLVIATFQRHALGPKWMVLRDQLFRHHRIFDALANLVADELGEQLVRLKVGQHVAEIAQPFAEAGLRPQFLEARLTFFRRNIEDRAGVEIVDKARKGFARPFKDFRVARFDFRLRLRIHRPIAQGGAIVGGTLKDRQMANFLGDFSN